MRWQTVLALESALMLLCACSSDPAPVDGGGTGETGDHNREEGLDPLSMPGKPTLAPEQFHSAAMCQGCHPNHYAEWQYSRHSRAMRDPVYRALVSLRQGDFDGMEDPFCTQCHSPICTRGGECGPMFSFDALSPIALEGVTCETCHKISAIVRPFNAGHELDPHGPIRGPIADPVDNGFHQSEHAPMFDDSALCGTCHDVIETSGLQLERPYAEWLGSPANPEQNCQSCHMPSYSGNAAVTGPARDNLHRHGFLGVDLPMEGDVDATKLAELDAEIEALLGTAASLALELPSSVAPGESLDVGVTIENRISGHAFPTGSTFLRQVWVELTVTDAEGEVVYATGELDSEGDLGDHWSTVAPDSDRDLIRLGSAFSDRHGEPELMSWRATQHDWNVLGPLQTRTFAVSVAIPEGLVGPLQIDAILHFRSYPPFLLRMLGLAELVELAVVRDIATASGSVEVGK